jgi:C-terminal domain of 1-Cys peroxiredoxin
MRAILKASSIQARIGGLDRPATTSTKWCACWISIQLTANRKVATPVNWKPGDDVIILPAVSDEEVKQKYPGGSKAPRP